jgi:hypothetical protein
MMLWMKRISVFLITLATLGMYTPPINLNPNTDDGEFISEKSSEREEATVPILDVAEDIDDITAIDERDLRTYIIDAITNEAKAHTIAKMGPKITKQVDTDLTTNIFPNIEAVLHAILTDVGDEAVNYYGISELPSKGYGERIFNIHDYDNHKDIARFDVRRENRPGEGYWFNFHFHLSKDGFEEHHPIGEIYWDKNMPPKWMA